MIKPQERARALRPLIVKAAAFLTDEDALGGIELFPAWQTDTDYTADERIRYDGKLYRVVQGHTSQSDWTPDITPALYTEVAPEGVIPVWRQPTGTQDAYSRGDRVYFPDENGNIFESLIDANVYSPEAYPQGWGLIE